MNNPPIFLSKRNKIGQFLPVIKTDEKLCSACKKMLPIKNFYPRKNRPLGLSPKCKPCERKRRNGYANIYREKNREEIRAKDRERNKLRPNRSRGSMLKRLYGITIPQFDEMLIKQKHLCAICGFKHDESKKSTKLHIDHCHKSKRVRSLLCSRCNKGLGHFKDNPKLIEAAIQYLKAHI